MNGGSNIRKNFLVKVVSVVLTIGALAAACVLYQWWSGNQTGPLLSSGATNVTRTAAVVSWWSGDSARTQVEYGQTRSYGSTASETTAPLEETESDGYGEETRYQHSIRVDNLTPGTIYYYKIHARGFLRTTGSFTTLQFTLSDCRFVDADEDRVLRIKFTASFSVTMDVMDANGDYVDGAEADATQSGERPKEVHTTWPLEDGQYTLVVNHDVDNKFVEIARYSLQLSGSQITFSEITHK
jgi:hypothetical protein